MLHLRGHFYIGIINKNYCDINIARYIGKEIKN